MHSVHEEHMLDSFCGFDQFADNHYAYDGSYSLDKIAEHGDKNGYKYHWW